MAASARDVTTLLHLAEDGDKQAMEELFSRVEAELRKKAKALLSHEKSRDGIQTTLLVDDAFLKLVGVQSRRWKWANRTHFYRRTAQAMRRILVDEARKRKARRRDPGVPVISLHGVMEPPDKKAWEPEKYIEVDGALARLAKVRPDLSELVEFHCFLGWQLKQIAEELLHISEGRVKEMWRQAKELLRQFIKENQP